MVVILKKSLIIAKQRYKDFMYHSTHKSIALKVLKNIESDKGKIDKRLIQLCNEYAADVLGSKKYAPWLYVYAALNSEFKEGWIPDNYFGKIVVPALKGDYGAIADNNALTSRLFNSSLFPDLLYFTNGLWMTSDYEVIQPNKVFDFIFKETDQVVYKIDNSGQGKGVHIFDRKSFDINHLMNLGNGVLQKFVEQHSFFQAMMPDSVACVRTTSVINDQGEISVPTCYIRVGRKNHSHLQPHALIRIAVNPKTGDLDKYGYLSNWLEIEKHPDTEFIFDGKKIPNFEKFIDASIALHRKVPFTRVIGWDMILDAKNNVQVLEWNGSHNDIKFSEVKQGPCFADLGWENLWRKE